MRRVGEHKDPDAVLVGRRQEDECVPDLEEGEVVVLASSAAVAYGSRSARRSQTSIGDLKAMIGVYVTTVKDKV